MRGEEDEEEEEVDGERTAERGKRKPDRPERDTDCAQKDWIRPDPERRRSERETHVATAERPSDRPLLLDLEEVGVAAETCVLLQGLRASVRRSRKAEDEQRDAPA